MNKRFTTCFLTLCCAALIFSGCAKKQALKAEEPVAPPKAVETAPPAQAPAEEPKQTKEEPTVKEETLQGGQTAPQAALQTIYFDFDAYVLSSDSREILKKNAAWMLKSPSAKVQVQGNCDERGSAEYNLALGEKRARAAMDYLVTLGVPAQRVSFISFGEEKPVDPGHDEAAWAKNRRADFAIQ